MSALQGCLRQVRWVTKGFGDSCATRSRGRSSLGPSENVRNRAEREADEEISDGSSGAIEQQARRVEKGVGEELATEGLEYGESLDGPRSVAEGIEADERPDDLRTRSRSASLDSRVEADGELCPESMQGLTALLGSRA